MLQLQIYNKEMFQNREYPIQFILGMLVFHKSNSYSVYNSSFKKFTRLDKKFTFLLTSVWLLNLKRFKKYEDNSGHEMFFNFGSSSDLRSYKYFNDLILTLSKFIAFDTHTKIVNIICSKTTKKIFFVLIYQKKMY